MMRIVGGEWRGRKLIAPPGQGTRPTADRVRQALFDMIMHAEWGGRALIEGATVLDVFAGTGALGLEALSRGAAFATFIESDPGALRALRANVAACKVEDRTKILTTDVAATPAGPPAAVAFLDPPYGQTHVPRAVAHLRAVGRIQPATVIVAEMGRDEAWVPDAPVLAHREYGAARIVIFRLAEP